MKKLVTQEKEIKQTLMSVDTFVKISSETHTNTQVQSSIDKSFEMFANFTKKYSRFSPESELSQLNESSGLVQVSMDLWEMLRLAKKYYVKTDGIFDIGILPILQNEGYLVSKSKGFVDFRINYCSSL